MQSSDDPADNNIIIRPRSPSKRKISEQLHKSAESRPGCEPPNSNKPPSTFPASKRLKTSHFAGNLRRQDDMSKIGVISRPGVVDLTKTSNLQPHTGARRLVIKNLRITSTDDVDRFYDKTWDDLDAALTSIYKGSKPAAPLEVLCRGVEATCRKGRAEKLASHIKGRNKAYLEKELLPLIVSESGSSNVDALRVVQKHWSAWSKQSILLRSIFSYLDRSYLLTAKDTLQLEDLGISQFRHATFNKDKKLASRVIAGVCDLIEYDRTNQPDQYDSVLFRESIAMLHILQTYGKAFEPEYLRLSEAYFDHFANERKSTALEDYISACDRLLDKEALRCDTYNFDTTSKRSVLTLAHRILIEQCSEILLSASGLSKLLDANALASLKTLYRLLTLSNIQDKLKIPWDAYIRQEGSLIVSDKDKVDEMVVRLLELKRKLDLIVRDCFEKDEAFTYTLREAFSNFINDRKNTSVWGSGNSKVGEMIAKYIDLLLRGGLKAVPRSLASDAKDRDAAEKQGQASTGDEDAELDRQLEQGLELFRFIEGKDVFEAFYKKDLARRLLMARSASQDAEVNMLAKLKAECGFSFTHNLDQMFKDQALAREEMISYKQSLSNTSKTTMDLQVSVLSSAAWPTYPDVEVKLPEEVARHIEKYDRHYKHKHSGRKLYWKHALSHSVVKSHFKKGVKELVVSGFQAVVLVLFNDLEEGGHLSYTDIAAATGLVDAELERTLQSLACAKFRILTKHPKGRDVNPTDTFTVNVNFTDPKFRIKINQIQLKETKEENQETHERVYQDRQYETQAAIVRIMKSRKLMTHSNLIAEVIDQTKKRGMVELSEIKKNIEKLIEKEYIEREDSSYRYLA